MIGSTISLTKSTSSWFSYITRRENPRIRLFCFPFAGGGAESYRDWATILPKEVEVWPVQIPGRSLRMMEPPIDKMGVLVESLADAISPYLRDMPFAFFGHSMGALVSYELTCYLRENELAMPATLFLSGRAAPLHSVGGLKHLLPDQDLIEELKQFDGTPGEVLDSPELLSLILPILRNDLKLLETYTFDSSRAPLDIPLHVTGGDTDSLVPVESLRDWSILSTAPNDVRIWSGGNFYLAKHKYAYLEALSNRILRLDR